MILHIVNLLVCFLLAWFASYYYAGPTFREQSLAEWMAYILSAKGNFLFTLGLLMFIIFLLDFPKKRIIDIIKRKFNQNKAMLWEAFVLFILLFDIYLYIFFHFGWYLVFPILFYTVLKGVV